MKLLKLSSILIIIYFLVSCGSSNYSPNYNLKNSTEVNRDEIKLKPSKKDLRKARTIDITDITIRKVENVNTIFSERDPYVTPDGKYLFFASTRGGMEWTTENYGNLNRNDYDIMVSKRINGKWTTPVNLGKNVNTKNDDAQPFVTPDGQTVYFLSFNENYFETQGPIYKSELFGSFWAENQGIGGDITRSFKMQSDFNNGIWSNGSTLSPNGDRLFYSYSILLDTMNIYYSQKINGKWTTTKKSPVSTDYFDGTPFLSSDNQTLFFSSNAYEGFGETDIYATVLNDNGTLGEVVNLGRQFNTSGYDENFVITADGSEAYFVRDGDIYVAFIDSPVNEIRPKPTVLVSGKIVHGESKEPKSGLIYAKDKKNNIIAQSRSNDATGEYLLVLPNFGDYTIIYNIFEKDTILQTIQLDEPRTITKNIDFWINKPISKPIEQKKEEPKKFIPPTINANLIFNSNSYKINSEYYKELDKIAEYLNEYPNAEFTINGYSDSYGPLQYNIWLSEKRAEAVKDYLVKSGIPANKFITSGLGPKNPIADNKTKNGRRLNRRVEINLK